MDIQDFLSGVSYYDLFDPTDSNCVLQDNLHNDWLDNIFSSSPSSSSSSSSSSNSAAVTGSDDLLAGVTTPESGFHEEHSYSIGVGQNSPSTNSWTSAVESGDSFDFLSEFRTSELDLTFDLLKENEAIKSRPPSFIADGGDHPDLDTDLDRWLESSLSSPSSSSELPETSEPIGDARPLRKSVVFLTTADGQVMKFTSEESSASDELILVDCSNDDELPKDPLDLSTAFRSSSSSSSENHSSGSVIRGNASTRVCLNSFSSCLSQRDERTFTSYTLTEALFSNPAPTEGVLLLTDEEKNTLMAEGYPVPTKLPLAKTEEKYLKKIRRKIKNKISAQESRKKKKEYMDHLEIKMHRYCEENAQLLKKVEQLENSNRLLIGQLQKQMKNSGSPPSTGGTRLMVLVLFFAAFIGSWSPMISWRIGFGPPLEVKDKPLLATGSSSGLGAGGLQALPMCIQPVGPDLQNALVDVYSEAYSKRSRLLMSTKDEEDDCNNNNNDNHGSCLNPMLFGPSLPASYMNTIAFWFNGVTSRIPGYPDVSARIKVPHQYTNSEHQDKESDEDLGFSVQHVLPLTNQRLFKESPTSSSNMTFMTFIGFTSPTQPLLPVPFLDQSEVNQVSL